MKDHNQGRDPITNQRRLAKAKVPRGVCKFELRKPMQDSVSPRVLSMVEEA